MCMISDIAISDRDAQLLIKGPPPPLDLAINDFQLYPHQLLDLKCRIDATRMPENTKTCLRTPIWTFF